MGLILIDGLDKDELYWMVGLNGAEEKAERFLYNGLKAIRYLNADDGQC